MNPEEPFKHPLPLQRHLGVGRAGVALQVAEITGGVLQAEAGLVALGHLPPRGGIQQVVVAELIHAVVVPGDGGRDDR